MAINQAKGRTTIGITPQTKEALSKMKHPGQSYDGVIRELVEFWREKRKPLKPHG